MSARTVPSIRPAHAAPGDHRLLRALPGDPGRAVTPAAFPLWLAPVQVVDRHHHLPRRTPTRSEVGRGARAPRGYACRDSICATKRSTTRCASHSLAKVPVIAVVGGREADEGTLALRRLGSKEQEILALADATARTFGGSGPAGPLGIGAAAPPALLLRASRQHGAGKRRPWIETNGRGEDDDSKTTVRSHAVPGWDRVPTSRSSVRRKCRLIDAEGENVGESWP